MEYSEGRVLHSPNLDPLTSATPPDVGGALLARDATLCSAYLRGVLQRIVARAFAHLGFDTLEPAASRSRYTVVAVGKKQPLWGVEDHDGRHCVEHLRVVLHPCWVEVRLGIDRRVGEEIGYSQLSHWSTMVALNP